VNTAALVEDLAESGWGRVQDFLDAAACTRLRRRLRYRLRRGSFSAATVGRAAARARIESIRGDRLCWLQADSGNAAERDWFERLDRLAETFNHELYAGIRRWEGHFAVYPPGAFYRRHIDRFRDDDARVISTVLYLNPRWRPEYGGQFRLFVPDPDHGETSVDIQPEQGTLVCFLSDRIPHEVLETTRDRLSIVGWFRRDD
jgi:SM-20-related protein